MLKINRAYSEITPESAEVGECSDAGMSAANAEYTFRELVDLLRQHPQCSCSPTRGATFEWFSTGYCTDDYTTGKEREETVHFSRDNAPHAARYWRLAVKAAGLMR